MATVPLICLGTPTCRRRDVKTLCRKNDNHFLPTVGMRGSYCQDNNGTPLHLHEINCAALFGNDMASVDI